MRALLLSRPDIATILINVYSGGPTDSPLTSHGFIQSHRLGAHLAGRIASVGPVTYLFSSDFQQAYKTAEAIRDAHPFPAAGPTLNAKPEIIQLGELREKDFGARDGKASDSTKVKAGGVFDAESETSEEVNARAKRFLDAILLPLLEDLLESKRLQSIVIVAHGGIHSYVWLQFILLLRNLCTQTISTPGTLQLESVPLDDFLANAAYHEIILKAPEQFLMASSSRPGDSRRAGQALSSVQVSLGANNYTDHLSGLKKTGGGIGSARFDAKQRTIDSFFGSKSHTR